MEVAIDQVKTMFEAIARLLAYGFCEWQIEEAIKRAHRNMSYVKFVQKHFHPGPFEPRLIRILRRIDQALEDYGRPKEFEMYYRQE